MSFDKIMFLLWTLIFLIGTLFFSTILYKKNIPRDWPSVQGIIINSKTVTDRVNTGGGGKGVSFFVYRLEATYNYSIDNRTYTNADINYPIKNFINSEGLKEGPAKILLQKYAKGKKVTVYYNPDKIQQSVLIREVPLNAWLIPVVFLLFTLYGIFGLYKIKKTEKNN